MYTSLAFGGGGVRGGLHVGAIAALEKFRGNLTFPDGIYGSSVGAILATAVAFNMSANQIRTMFETHFNLDNFIPPLRIACFASLLEKKGLFPMDLLEQTLTNAFSSQNVDLRGKLIGDAPQPLHIVASNMTTQSTTVFSKNVGILDAIKCSACLPIVYEPQIVGPNLYMDGGIFMESLCSITPPSALILHISEPAETIQPKELAEISIGSFLHRVYRGTRPKPLSQNTLWLHNASVSILQELTPADKKLLYDEGYSQTLAFLSKRFPKELK